jgi:3-hydroxyisobutyrate dehydrogenase
MSKPRVAFLGLGIMGSGMSRRLLGAGFPLTVYNRNPEKSAPLAAAGAQVASSAREAAAQADVVISMLADDAAARSVWLGDNGALTGAKKGAILVESSTVSPEWINELDAAAKKMNCDLLDAPVTGSKPQAAAGELNFLVGGSEGALSEVRPVLKAMSKSITHLGPIGSGALMKLVNNFVCGAQITALAEALAWIERSNLDRDKALAVLTSGAPGSPLVKTLAARMTAHDYTPNFLLRLMAKDLAYAVKENHARGIVLESGATALAAFQRAIQGGQGDKDMSAVVEQFRALKK